MDALQVLEEERKERSGQPAVVLYPLITPALADSSTHTAFSHFRSPTRLIGALAPLIYCPLVLLMRSNLNTKKRKRRDIIITIKRTTKNIDMSKKEQGAVLKGFLQVDNATCTAGGYALIHLKHENPQNFVQKYIHCVALYSEVTSFPFCESPIICKSRCRAPDTSLCSLAYAKRCGMNIKSLNEGKGCALYQPLTLLCSVTGVPTTSK